MALANFDLERLRAKILDAYRVDDPVLEEFRGFARRLKNGLKPLRPYAVNAVSFVSADGGDNRISFNPAVIELVRVVDSRGVECVLDALASTATEADLDDRAQVGGAKGVSPVQRLCTDLGMPLSKMSYLLKGMGKDGKSTGAIRCYRDMVEWAVLYDLAANPNLQWGCDTILVRDGLLRTKSFKTSVFPQLDQKMRTATQAHSDRGVTLSIVGVAKQSAILSRLAVALEIEATFDKDFPCFVEVPEDIEKRCYNFDRTWLATYESSEPNEDGTYHYQNMGQMYLVKFGDRPMDPVWPVDVAKWQVNQADRVLGQLMVDAQQGFPIPDYPMCIQRAHDFAKLTGLEVEVLQDELVQGILRNLNPEQGERLLRLKHLGQNLAAARYKEA